MPPWITFLTNEFFSVDWHGFSMVAWCAISYRLNCGLVFFSSTQIGKTQKIYHLHNKLTKMIKYTKQKKKTKTCENSFIYYLLELVKWRFLGV
jgi:hypothetical protein